MFEVLIVQPIFNLLVLVYSLLPGHNFGLALLIFTIIVRLLMWPLVKKQLHHAKAMRELQPEIRKIKKEAKGNRQKESMMIMALYKEKEVSPFGSLGVLAVQLLILIGLYSGLRRVIENPQAILDLAYSFLQSFGWMAELSKDISLFDGTLLGAVDLTKAAYSPAGWYLPALALVAGSAAAQYYQSKQLMPDDKNARSLKQIFKEASEGKTADQMEVNAAMTRGMKYMIPAMIFFFTIGLPSALALYWLVSGAVAYWQQAKVLQQDVEELEEIADKDGASRVYIKSSDRKVIEGEVIESNKTKTAGKRSKKGKKSKSSRKRRT